MSSCGGFSSSSEGHESRRASSRGLIPKAKVKTVKMTFVIIFVFILCWGPYFGFDLLQVQFIKSVRAQAMKNKGPDAQTL